MILSNIRGTHSMDFEAKNNIGKLSNNLNILTLDSFRYDIGISKEEKTEDKPFFLENLSSLNSSKRSISLSSYSSIESSENSKDISSLSNMEINDVFSDRMTYAFNNKVNMFIKELSFTPLSLYNSGTWFFSEEPNDYWNIMSIFLQFLAALW